MSGWEKWIVPKAYPAPEEENVLRPEVARRLVAYGVRRGLLRHRGGILDAEPNRTSDEEDQREESYGVR
jgi:hypothetical protein